MYAGPWEVVGKNKKDKSGLKANKLTKTEKKKFIDNAPKVEDFLPLDQVKTLYDNFDNNNKESKKITKEKDNKTKDNEEKKKQKSPIVEKKKEEPKEPKEKKPKSIEEALNNIKVADVQNLLATNQLSFPDAHLVWLKALVAYINSKMLIEKDDPIFSGKSEGFPLNAVSKNLRVLLEKTIESAGPQNARLFYEYLLTAMSIEMVKGTPVIGYKIFIQLLAKYDHTLSSYNIPKLISMRNSYQNRKSIAMGLLWSFNQGGRENLDTGLKVWHEVMAPILETKSYSNFVLKILSDLLESHTNNDSLDPDHYLNILEDVYSEKFSCSKLIFNDASKCLQNLRIILFQNKSINYKKLFESLLSKISSRTPDNIKQELIEALVCCLITEERCYLVWKSLFMKYLFGSTELLIYIEHRWDSLKNSVNPAMLREVLSTLQFAADKTKKSKSKDDKYLQTCQKSYQEIIRKMTSKSTKKGFSWRKVFFFLLIIISAWIAYDIRKYKSFEASKVGKVLKDSGTIDIAQRSWNSTKAFSAQVLKYVESTSPEYYKFVVDNTTPYIKLIGDVYVSAKNIYLKLSYNIVNYISTTAPTAVKTIEHYAPGLIDSIQVYSVKGLEMIKIYSALTADHVINYSIKAATWLKTNVFVGNLSPENLQKYASQAANTIQSYASQSYDWVYKKVQTLSKVE